MPSIIDARPAPAGRQSLIGMALGLALLGAPCPAGAAVATSVVSASAVGPNAAMTGDPAGAACAGQVSGGGGRMDQAALSNGVHLVGSFPSPDGTAAAADGDADPKAWVAQGGVGGQAASGVSTWAYAVCASGLGGATRVAMATTSGPLAGYHTTTSVASCPPGTRALGGGSRTTPATVGSLKASGSFPSAGDGTPVLSGTNPTAWTGVGLDGDQPDQGNTTQAFVLCAPAAALPDITVVNARVPGPVSGSTPAQVTVSCPAATALLSGGGFISDNFGIAGSQGDHLTGSFPSDAAGAPVTSGPAGSWTVLSHAGGMPSGALTTTDAWALCALGRSSTGPGSPAPGPPATGAAPGVSPPPPPAPGVSTVSRAQVLASLRRQIAPRGRAARIGAILSRRSFALTLTAPEAGTVRITWTTVARRSVLVARGGKRFAAAATATIKVDLTTAGRRALKLARRLAVTVRATLTRPGRAALSATRDAVLTR